MEPTTPTEGAIEEGAVDESRRSNRRQQEAVDRARELSERYRMPLVDLAATGVATEAAKLIPLSVLERVGAIPYALRDGVLEVAVTDPEDIRAIDELRLAARQPLELAIAPAEDIQLEVRRLVRASEALDSMFDDGAFTDVVDEDDLEADDGVSDGPLVRLVNQIIFQAAEAGASDVHFEPTGEGLVVRFRVDGVLSVAHRVPRQLMRGVITRLKVLAKLDIAERRKPQDGRISLNAAAAGRLLDIRVATLPTVEGESLVMRLLDKSRDAPTLEALGLTDAMRDTLREVVTRSTGALLVTGPTGSGKSTSLYAALTLINRPELNIITVEDPVEYRLVGVNQVQINPRAGLTFATALRAILRSDPDVVMVGEIRDAETAKISIEAALTGHFVLSTLHTNDAPGAITRLNEMGIEPFLTGSAVSAVLAQRLARRLCDNCSEVYTPSQQELTALRLPPETLEARGPLTFRRKVGCQRCGNSGYRGRIGVFQLLLMNDELETLVSEKGARDVIERAAVANGMRTLWDDGAEKVLQGVTTLEELARVVT